MNTHRRNTQSGPLRFHALAWACVLAFALLAPSLGCTAEAARDTVAPVATATETPQPAPAKEPTPAATQKPKPAPKPKPAAKPATAPTAKFPAGRVEYVVDGDTAHIRLANGVKEKVRFIGIDTPESTNRTDPYGPQASSFTKNQLLGKTVYLERDAEERDRYGRLLAYIWMAQPKLGSDGRASSAEARAKMFNAELAIKGYAQQMTYPPNVRYADYFRTYVAEARNAGRGLWADEASAEAWTEGQSDAGRPSGGSSSGGAVTGGGSGGSSDITTTYVGNRNTMKFHEAGCSSDDDMLPTNRVPIEKRAEAIAAGYIPCKRCNP